MGKSPSRQKCLDRKTENWEIRIYKWQPLCKPPFLVLQRLSSWLNADSSLDSLPDGQHFWGNWFTWTNRSQEVVDSDLSFGTLQGNMKNTFQKLTRQLDFHSCTPTGFVIGKCIKPSAIKQQAPSAVGSAWWRTKRLQYLIRLTPQHGLANTPGTACLQRCGRNSVTWLWQHYSQPKQWSETAQRESIFKPSRLGDKKSLSWFIPPEGGQALHQSNCITFPCRGVIYTLFLW